MATQKTIEIAGRCPFIALFSSRKSPITGPLAETAEDDDRVYPPGPAGIPFAGSLPRYLRNPILFLSETRTYGDIVHFKFGKRHVYQLNHPDLIQNVLTRDYSQFHKTGTPRRAESVFGRGLLTAEGDHHKRQKRMIQPAFSPAVLKTYAREMAPVTARFSRDWRSGDVLNISSEMSRLALLIAGKTLFGKDFGKEASELEDAVRVIIEHFNRLMSPMGSLLCRLPLPKNRAFNKAMALIDSVVRDLIQNDDSESDPNNLLSIYLKHARESRNSQAPRQTRDDLVSLFLAGHETVATHLMWTLVILARHPDIAERLREEIKGVFGMNLPNATEIDKAERLDRVIKESMRLYPPVWNLARDVRTDYPVGPYVIPAGSIIGMSQFLVQRDPRFFPDPERFDPDRWTDDETKKRPLFSYFPFGAGPRVCIGARFAMLEAKLVLSTLIQHFRFELLNGRKLGFKPSITLRPTPDIKMRVVSHDDTRA